MGLSGCMSCLKYLLFAFNFIFWLAGIGILAIAIYFRVDPSTQSILASNDDERDLFYGVCYVLMAAGGAIMVVGFCGCCGAVQESRMLLSLFAIALFLLLGTEIGAGVYTAVNKEQVYDAIDKRAVDLWKGALARNETKMIVDEIEEQLDCCGYHNARDYCDLSSVSLEAPNNVINSLIGEIVRCADVGTSINDYCPTAASVLVGCRQRILEVLSRNLNIVIGVAIGIGVVELLGLIFSILLCQAIGQDYTAGKLG